MKKAFLLLLFLPLCFTLYIEAPVDSVYNDNKQIAPILNNSFSSQYSKSHSIGLFSTSLPIKASFKFLAAYPSINNSLKVTNTSYILSTWGVDLSHLPTTQGFNGYCTSAECVPMTDDCGNRCDHDGDSCAEYEAASYYNKTAFVTFCFKKFCEELIATDNLVPIPQNIIEKMKNSSGIDNLTVKINATLTIHYSINDRKPGNISGCTDNFSLSSYSFSFYEEMNFTAENNNVLYFLRAPVLREQWYKNNRFDSIILSTSKLSSVSIYLNDNRTRVYPLYFYNVTMDQFGVSHIIPYSQLGYQNVVEGLSDSTPILLTRSNQTFGYVYEINYSYPGTGKNNLTLVITNQFNEKFSFNESLFSRTVTHRGNISEFNYTSETARKSFESTTDELTTVSLSFGMLGLLLLLLFINRIKK